MRFVFTLCLFTLAASAADIRAVRAADPRNIANGLRIPAENYVDQPYVAVAQDGAWICVLTTGQGLEGQQGQHVIALRSEDRGKTWAPAQDLEPADGPEASWATPFVAPYGRVYVFYVYNGDKIVTLPGSDRRVRSDTHGWLVYRYSDDNGKTWSAQRHRVPLRATSVDRGNPWQGSVLHFWTVDKPSAQNGRFYLAITKLGRFFMKRGEGWIVESSNLLTERDPDKIAFRLLPEGDEGVRNPSFGDVQEEFNLVPTGGDGLYLVNRLSEGFPAQSVSTNGGASWSQPAPVVYANGARPLKTPRACTKLFRTSEGRYLLWFHNHGGKGWSGRNPGFLCGGVETVDGEIRWSEPEIALFDPMPSVRMSYPDLIEQDGRFWLTESQKTAARVHPLDRSLLEGLWGQATNRTVAAEGLALEWKAGEGASAAPTLPFSFGQLDKGGLSVELAFSLDTAAPGQTLFSTQDKSGKGVRVATDSVAGEPVLSIRMNDGIRCIDWQSDPDSFEGARHAAFIADFSAGVVSVILDGRFCDGGSAREQGWGRLPSDMRAVKGAFQAEISPKVSLLRLYDRPLRTSEAVAAWRNGEK